MTGPETTAGPETTTASGSPKMTRAAVNPGTMTPLVDPEDNDEVAEKPNYYGELSETEESVEDPESNKVRIPDEVRVLEEGALGKATFRELIFDTDEEEDDAEETESDSDSGSESDKSIVDPNEYGGKHHSKETKEMLQEFRALMAPGSINDFVFACGGSLPIKSRKKKENPQPAASKDQPPEQQKTEERRASVSTVSSASTSFSSRLTVSSCKPVTLRWDPSDPRTPASDCKLVFPIEEGASDNMARLVADMAPATFGRGNEDVYDESYRKALKLNPSQFTTDFCPHEYGIIDIIAQVLLPTLNTDLITWRGVRAELYKLNVRTPIESTPPFMYSC